ncbi:MAG: RND family efflux transporter MFP subunit [Bermanella sp.]|jgi:RND family efflux transporter MFP subunit
MPKFPAALLFALVLAPPLGWADSDYRHPVLAYTLHKQASYSAERRFSGRAQSQQHSALAFELSGRVDAVFVEAGQTVHAGDVLVKLDTRLLETQAAEVNAAIAENVASLAKTEQDLRRQRSLQRKGYSSHQDIDELQARGKILNAQRNKLNAQLRGVDIRLQKSTLRSPFDGEITLKSVDTGVVVKEGQTALEVVEAGHREAVIGVPEALRSSVSAGDEVTVRGIFGETQAKVLSVAHTLNPGTLTHSVRIAFADDIAVADGSIVYMLLAQTEDIPGFWLPLSAMLEGYRGMWAVYALKDSGELGLTLEKHSVSPVYQAGDRVFVTSDLLSNTQVVAAGVHRFAAGQRVQISDN